MNTRLRSKFDFPKQYLLKGKKAQECHHGNPPTATSEIFVKAADKGGALVVWRADLYQKEALRQLSDTSFYAKVDKDLTSTNQQIVKSTINELIVKQDLPATATNLIITTPRTSCIYFLPKIHKPNNPGRPIVSACSCPTELISSYLDKIMAPIVRSLPSYVKDSQHALQIFRDFIFVGEDKLIFTMDITSLYTVIPNGEGLLALKHFFDLRTVKVLLRPKMHLSFSPQMLKVLTLSNKFSKS